MDSEQSILGMFDADWRLPGEASICRIHLALEWFHTWYNILQHAFFQHIYSHIVRFMSSTTGWDILILLMVSCHRFSSIRKKSGGVGIRKTGDGTICSVAVPVVPQRWNNWKKEYTQLDGKPMKSDRKEEKQLRLASKRDGRSIHLPGVAEWALLEWDKDGKGQHCGFCSQPGNVLAQVTALHKHPTKNQTC